MYKQLRKQEKLSELQKQRIDTIYRRLSNGLATKEELMQLIGVTNDRPVRDCISIIKRYKPVISLSGEKGYRLAMTMDDLEDAKHMIASEISRANEVLKGIAELKNFVAKLEA